MHIKYIIYFDYIIYQLVITFDYVNFRLPDYNDNRIFFMIFFHIGFLKIPPTLWNFKNFTDLFT